MVKVISEEDYLNQNGASRQGFGDAALHKNIPYSRVRQQLLDRQLEKDRKLAARRETLRIEYRKLVKTGKIRPPSSVEALLLVARGHPDNESTQAARRVLAKRGIDWRIS